MQNLIGYITFFSVIIPVAAVNWGSKYIKRYENVTSTSHSL